MLDGRVKIYIYLDSPEMKEKLPPEITITGFDGKIVGALVSSDNLDTLDKLEFVQKVTVPVLAQTPPIPKIENQEADVSTESKFDFIYWVFILGTVVFLAITLIKKSKTWKTRTKKN